jgi:hypothetical protein
MPEHAGQPRIACLSCAANGGHPPKNSLKRFEHKLILINMTYGVKRINGFSEPALGGCHLASTEALSAAGFASV